MAQHLQLMEVVTSINLERFERYKLVDARGVDLVGVAIMEIDLVAPNPRDMQNYL